MFGSQPVHIYLSSCCAYSIVWFQSPTFLALCWLICDATYCQVYRTALFQYDIDSVMETRPSHYIHCGTGSDCHTAKLCCKLWVGLYCTNKSIAGSGPSHHMIKSACEFVLNEIDRQRNRFFITHFILCFEFMSGTSVGRFILYWFNQSIFGLTRGGSGLILSNILVKALPSLKYTFFN